MLPPLPGKLLSVLFCVLFSVAVHAQHQYGAGEYLIDTTVCKLCDSAKHIPQYYSLHLKYPLSSEALVKKATEGVRFPGGFDKSGYVTVRFIVNCMGEPTCYHIYQVDGNYRSTVFPSEITAALQQFVKDMGKWPQPSEKPTNYYAYLTFKIEHGKISQIVP